MMSIVLDRRRDGQALVEFALVLPVFLLLFFGLIDLGRYVFVTNAFNQASREAARYGAVEQWAFACPASVPIGSQTRYTCTLAVAKERLVGSGIDPALSQVTCSDGVGAPRPQSSPCRANDLLKVYLTTGTGANRFGFLTPILGQLVSPPVIVGQAQVAVQ